MINSKEKILITGGCSFSDTNIHRTDTLTWPIHLAERMPQHRHISKGIGSQGNGLISRSIIHACMMHKNSDLFVGILWSGSDRHDFYIRDSKISMNIDDWNENPTGFTGTKNWIITNPHWRNRYAKTYYEMFHDTVGQLIYTLEHILRTQWFLKQNNIPYFMSMFTDNVLTHCDHEDCKYLYDQIDWDCFLPIDGMDSWIRENIGKKGFKKRGDNHPSTLGHKEFTEKIIMPFIKKYNKK